MEKNIAGTCLDTTHPSDPLVIVRLIDKNGLVEDATYLGASMSRPTARIFARSCILRQKADAQALINNAPDGDAPNWINI